MAGTAAWTEWGWRRPSSPFTQSCLISIRLELSSCADPPKKQRVSSIQYFLPSRLWLQAHCGFSTLDLGETPETRAQPAASSQACALLAHVSILAQ